MIEDPFTYGTCPVCDSPYKAYLRDVGAGRSRKSIPLYACLSCRSFTCGGDYKEDEATLKRDAEYHAGLIEQKAGVFRDLASKLARWPYLNHVTVDVGCGVGGFVSEMRNVGMVAHGYDINPWVIERAKALHPKFADKFIHADKCPIPAPDLITAIDVLEHARQPRELMRDFSDRLSRNRLLYVTVPRLDENLWHCLREPIADQMKGNASKPTFCDCDVHVTHFSTEGLIRMAKDFGFRVVDDWTRFAWPANGLLFQKV